MSLDRHAAERRRFARLLGIDGELGCGLPIGPRSSDDTEGDDGRTTEPRSSQPTDGGSPSRPRDRRGTS